MFIVQRHPFDSLRSSSLDGLEVTLSSPKGQGTA